MMEKKGSNPTQVKAAHYTSKPLTTQTSVHDDLNYNNDVFSEENGKGIDLTNQRPIFASSKPADGQQQFVQVSALNSSGLSSLHC